MLFESVPDYVDKFIISTSSKGDVVQITYTYLQYDLIDKNLDFDEKYYLKVIENFKMILSRECAVMVKDNQHINCIYVSCSQTIMKEPDNGTLHELDMTFTKDMLTTTSYAST